MAEQGTATETQAVADDELSAAWDAVEKKEETTSSTEPETKTPPETASAEEDEFAGISEEQKHKIKSKQGRQIKGLQSRLEMLTREIEGLKSKPAESSVNVPETITTAQDVESVLEARDQRRVQEQKKYEGQYVAQLNQLAASNGDLHDEIVAEMMANFNRRLSDNAQMDARVNYSEAKSALLERRNTGQLPNRATTSAAPVQPAANTTRTATKTVSLPKLDAETQEYANYLKSRGMSDEDIAKELS